MAGFAIRTASFPQDDSICAGFIQALQLFEKDIEPNRRTDAAVGAEYFAELKSRLAAKDGRAFVAESGGSPIGWAACHTGSDALYVVPEEQRFGYVAELYVDEGWRGSGAGQALLAACEAHIRGLGLGLMMIGVLAQNGRAEAAYRKFGFSPYAAEMRKYLR